MTLPIIFALVTLTLFGSFWGGSLIGQGYLYSQPAERLPLRAAVAALLVGGFLTLWCWIDRRAPGKYDTFFEFANYTARDIDNFEAVRWQADPVAAAKGKLELKKNPDGSTIESTAKFHRAPGGKSAPFVQDGTNQPFKLNDSTMMTGALLAKVDDGAPVRFKADMKKDDRTGSMAYASEKRFTEERGSRYIKADQLGVVYIPSDSVVVLALLINAIHFAVWVVAFWPVLRFGVWHSVGFAAVFGLATMLLVMPLLFRPSRTAPAPVAVACASSMRWVG